MKIWHQYGSEHSANLVMIGHFEDATEATKAKEILDAIGQQVLSDEQSGEIVFGSPSARFGICRMPVSVFMTPLVMGRSRCVIRVDGACGAFPPATPAHVVYPRSEQAHTAKSSRTHSPAPAREHAVGFL